MPKRAATLIASSFFTGRGARLNAHAYIFLVLLCLAFFVPGIATLPPTDRDESLFAQASKQMVESGNYVDIRFQNEPRYRKPIGIYWLQAASAKLFNPNHLDEIWAYRLPSLLGATLAVAMTAALGMLFVGPMAGFIAAIMMASCLLLNVEARLAKTDASLLGAIMVAQYAMARAYMRFRKKKIGWGVPLAFWTAISIGILIKGPIILLVVLATLLWLRISEKNLAWFAALKPLIGIPYVLLLVAPWFVSIMMESHGQFLQQSAGHDLLGKLWEGQGRGFIPPGAYLLIFPVTFFPFALWAMLAAPDSWRNRREPAVRFCLGWIVPSWIVFELALAKLPHYVLPVYPAIAILAAKALLDGHPALAAGRWRWLKPCALGIWFVSILAFVLAANYLSYMTYGLQISALGPATIWLTIASMEASKRLFSGRREIGVIFMAAGSLYFMIALFAYTLPELPQIWLSRDIVREAQGFNPCPGAPRIAAAAYNEPSLVFLAGTGTIMKNDGASIAEALRQDKCRIGAIGDGQRDAFLKSFAGASVQPRKVAAIEGFVMSRNRAREIELYVMPQETISPP